MMAKVMATTTTTLNLTTQTDLNDDHGHFNDHINDGDSVNDGDDDEDSVNDGSDGGGDIDPSPFPSSLSLPVDGVAFLDQLCIVLTTIPRPEQYFLQTLESLIRALPHHHHQQQQQKQQQQQQPHQQQEVQITVYILNGGDPTIDQ